MPLSEAPRRDLKTAVLSILVGLVGEAHIVHVRFYSSWSRGRRRKTAKLHSALAEPGALAKPGVATCVLQMAARALKGPPRTRGRRSTPTRAHAELCGTQCDPCTG